MLKGNEIKIYIGYHGTSRESATLIQKSNFNRSINRSEWLGSGVYFFTDGIKNPRDHAYEWAKCRDCKQISIISVLVSGTKVLDITNQEGIDAYNEMRDIILEQEKEWFPNTKNRWEDNTTMWELIADYLKIEIIIHNLYIKNSIAKLNSNVPNTTVMCVKNNDNIDIESLAIEFIGVR